MASTFGIQAPDYPDDGCALIFGGTGGLGAATAGLLAQRGCDIVLTYRSREKEAKELAEEIRGMGRKATALPCDVTDKASCQEVVDKAVSEYGRIHTVLSAGGLVFAVGPLAEFEPQDFRDVIDVDVIGFFNITQTVVPAMREKGGSIVALITCATDRIVPTDALSAVPKAAVTRMMKHVAAEEAPNGIRANAVGPGVIDGGMVIPLMETDAKALLDMAVDFTPLGRLGECEEVAEAVAFLASSKSAYITGQELMVDGGLAI